MIPNERELCRRVQVLERRIARMTTAAIAGVLCLLCIAVIGAAPSDHEPRELTVKRLVVVDSQGKPRIILGEDPQATDRISRAAGIALYDKSGAERAGLSTMADGSVVLGLDAPLGVGSPMRDRIGLKVYPDGSATISLIGNDTGIPVQLASEAKGGGGVEFYDYDLEKRLAFIKRIDFKGESTSQQALGGN